jgi:CHAT domain-containing protein
MMNLELKADLVVLSACETARGRLAQGEGVIGMSWALFVAGCPTVVVSEWKVDSASTTQLMLEFHKHLRRAMHGENHGMSVAKSLRESAVKMLHSAEYHHPFYWAGFVVIGAGLN